MTKEILPNGPFRLEMKVALHCDGTGQSAVATYELQDGAYPAKEDISKGLKEAVKGQTKNDTWRLQTKKEVFKDMVGGEGILLPGNQEFVE